MAGFEVGDNRPNTPATTAFDAAELWTKDAKQLQGRQEVAGLAAASGKLEIGLSLQSQFQIGSAPRLETRVAGLQPELPTNRHGYLAGGPVRNYYG